MDCLDNNLQYHIAAFAEYRKCNSSELKIKFHVVQGSSVTNGNGCLSTVLLSLFYFARL